MSTKSAPSPSKKSSTRRTAKPAGKSTPRPSAKPAAKAPPKRKTPPEIVSTGFWLMKSEPDVFSWDDLKKKGKAGEPWTGVRNYLARNNMRAMKLGDLVLFYHSNIGKEIVGIAKVSALAHPDPEDATGTWECVDVIAVSDLPKPVTLTDVKENAKLSAMSLVTSMRLSVQPVTADEWHEVCRMAGVAPDKIK